MSGAKIVGPDSVANGKKAAYCSVQSGEKAPRIKIDATAEGIKTCIMTPATPTAGDGASA